MNESKNVLHRSALAAPYRSYPLWKIKLRVIGELIIAPITVPVIIVKMGWREVRNDLFNELKDAFDVLKAKELVQ